MNITNYKQSAAYYLRRILLILFFLGLIIWTTHSYPFFPVLFPPVITDYTTLAKETNLTSSYVNLSTPKLYYTGCDNTRNGVVVGHYYYALEDNCCMLFLLKSGDSKPEQVITSYRSNYKLLSDEHLMNNLTTSLATEVSWKPEALKNITVPMLASETDYPHTSTVILAVTLSIVTLLLVIYFFIYLYRFIHITRKR